MSMPSETTTPITAHALGISPRRKMAATVVTQGMAAVNSDVSIAPKSATAWVYRKIEAAPIKTP